MSGRVLCIVVVHPSLYSLQADKKALEETEAELKKEMTSLKERNHSLGGGGGLKLLVFYL